MKEPLWIDKAAVLLLHEETLAEHGGGSGFRDEGLLDSALARARNIYLYEGVQDPSRLAAAYGFGIAKNHAFVDGNKRAAFLAIGLFLARNGFRLTADKVNATRVISAVESGEMSEENLGYWISENLSER